MLDKDIVLGYRENVIAVSSIREQIDINRRIGLPVEKLIEQEGQLIKKVSRFEDILERIPDIRTRTIFRCRYALGMSERDTAAFVGLTYTTIHRICTAALQRIS